MSHNEKPIVAGIPGTGNNLISSLVEGRIFHYGRKSVFPHLSSAVDVPVILPVRDREVHWFRSTGRTDAGDTRMPGKIPGPHMFSSCAELHHAHWWPTLNLLGGVAPLIVRYSDVIADPEHWRKVILEHCGIHDDRPWPKPVTDEDAKWREKMP